MDTLTNSHRYAQKVQAHYNLGRWLNVVGRTWTMLGMIKQLGRQVLLSKCADFLNYNDKHTVSNQIVVHLVA